MSHKLSFALLCVSLLKAQSPDDATKLVTLNGIKFQSTHLPEKGLMQISGLKIGQKVNLLIVDKACHNITATGLVKKIDYAYDVYPDKPGVTLVLTFEDEKPLLPATIAPPSEDERLWSAAQQAEPLLLRQFPPTEKALRFYADRFESVLKQLGRNDQYLAPTVIGDAKGEPASILFTVRTYKNTK